MHKTAWSSVAVAVAGLLLAGQTAQARAPGAAGRPDPSFGRGGFSEVGFPRERTVGGPVVVQPDGKVVTAFSSHGIDYPGSASPPLHEGKPYRQFVGLARFGHDGRLDRSFGDRGVVQTFGIFGGRDSGASEPLRADGVAVTDLIRQPDGRLLLAGMYARRAAVLRYLPDGRLDSSFGIGGIAYASTDFSGRMNAIGLLPDGMIVGVAWTLSQPCVPVGYMCFAVPVEDSMRLVKFTPAGLPAAVVPGSPWPTSMALPRLMVVYDLAVTSDGSVVLAGSYDFHFAIMRLTPLGLPDRSFGTRGDGIVVSPVPGAGSYARSVITLGSDVVATGHADPRGREAWQCGFWQSWSTSQLVTRSAGSLILARYSTQGVPVKSFGTGGRVLTGPRNATLCGSAVVATRDGLVVAGAHQALTRGKDGLLRSRTRRGLVARYTERGQLDQRFAAKGIAVAGTPTHYHSWLFDGLALDAQQRIVVAGSLAVERPVGPPAFVRLLVGRFHG